MPTKSDVITVLKFISQTKIKERTTFTGASKPSWSMQKRWNTAKMTIRSIEESARTNTWQGRLRSKGAIIFILPRNQRVHCRLREHENVSPRASHESEIRNIAANRRSKQAVQRRCVRRYMKAMTLPLSFFIRAASLWA